MADYTALVEAGSALVEMLRDNLTPEPIGNRELIALCSPHESENNQLTLYLYQVEEDTQGAESGYYQVSPTVQRIRPARYNLRFLVTAHSKAPVQLRQADQYRMVGAALQVLRDHPVIDREYLSGSLAEQDARIHVVLEKTSQDQLLKIWNNNSSTYKLSFVVLLTGIEIDSKRERRVGRVTDVTIHTAQTPKGGSPLSPFTPAPSAGCGTATPASPWRAVPCCVPWTGRRCAPWPRRGATWCCWTCPPAPTGCPCGATATRRSGWSCRPVRTPRRWRSP